MNRSLSIFYSRQHVPTTAASAIQQLSDCLHLIGSQTEQLQAHGGIASEYDIMRT